MEHIIVNNAKTGKQYKITNLSNYIVDQNVKVPADFFNFALPNTNGQVSDAISAGDEVFFYINDKLVVNGLIDDFEVSGDNENNNAEIVGRDKTSLLLDNDALPTTLYKLNLLQYLQKQVTPYGIKKFNVSNSEVFDKISINPGDSEWSILDGLAGSKGLYPRYEADVLVCTNLRADTNKDYHFSNDLDKTIRYKSYKIKVSSDVKNEVLVYGGHYSRGDYVNSGNIKGSSKDTGLKIQKRKVINDDDLENNAQANKLAKEELKSANREAFVIELELQTTQPIFTNKVAQVTIKRLGLDCFMLIDHVQYIKNIQSGSITKVTLKLIEGVGVNWKNHNIPTLMK